ncbi:hypothetical protein PGT21_014414 [Puccinia graminis f. sp. tritici]|uniref:Uncharacterized protein n=1 Tax=Puccinia graminis f. sp. tritici TaxID=56615 RepID=A0A5B0P5X8_PUCGR|nr:hypothetical protein PGT21_014414 [Puccinia graminis f. sp. tritici]
MILLGMAEWLSTTIWRIKKSRNTVPVLKGSLAYVLFFILFFLKPFQNLFPIPSAGSSAVLITILGFPGWSVDACLHSLFRGMLGAAIGGLNFLILGKLAPHPVAQAAVFFIMVYIPALIKTRNPSNLVFSLYCICMSWNGVYSSSSSPNRQYSPALLASFLQTYAWGAAIVAFVNIFILPHSSEAELRTTLVHCIDNIRTLAFLIKKTYWCEITEEESKVRDDLVQSIRADCHILQAKLNRTFLGLTYSKWSGNEYKKMVQLTQSMQQSLISTHSNLNHMEQPEARIFIDQVIATGAVNSELLRKYLYVGLTEVQRELAPGSESAPFMRQEMELLKEINTGRLAKKSTRSGLRPRSVNSIGRNGPGGNADTQEATSQLRDVQNNIALEISGAAQGAIVDVIESTACMETCLPNRYSPSGQDLTVSASPSRSTRSNQVNSSIRQLWTDLQMLQHELVGQMFKSGKVYHPDEPLLIDLFAPPAKQQVSSGSPYERLGERLTASNPIAQHCLSALQPIIPIGDETPPAESQDLWASPTIPQKILDYQQKQFSKDELHRSLLRTFSHSCIMGMFLEELIELRELVLGMQSDGYPRRKKFRLNLLTGIKARSRLQNQRKPEVENQLPCHDRANEAMTMQEALETLKGKQYVPKKKSLLERTLQIEKFLRSPDSICAAKVACAVSTLAILYWAESTREFAETYNLNTAILPLIFAITPTLGQSWLSFTLQISGAGIGLLYSMIVLEIFKNTGGYKYNPYGIISAMVLFSVPMNYILYTKPKLFVLSALAMNSAGTMIYPMYLNQNTTFDTPAHRMGKNLTSLAVAVAIVTFLQLFVLRNPARRTLRKAVAKVMRANTAYMVILQAYVSSTIPIDPNHRPPPEAIQKVAKDLIKREAQIQDGITALMPLMNFSGVEPSLGKPFNAAEYLKIARANQLILDRNRDARIAIGTTPLPRMILTEFVEKLAPYRGPTLSRIKTSFYLCTSTLQSKFPLPETVNSTGNQTFGKEIFHDALVLACRLAASSEGLQLIKSKEWTRYWLYLSSINSTPYQLESIQDSTKKLFGKLEDETFR